MGRNNMAVFEFYPKRGVGKCLIYDTFHLNGFFFRQGLQFSLVKRLANCAETTRLMQCDKPLFGHEIADLGYIRGPVRKLLLCGAKATEFIGELGALD